MNRNIRIVVRTGLLCAFVTGAALAQPATKAPATVPRLVKFSGTRTAGDGKAAPGTVGVTFALYEREHGGAPLWMETQNVQIDAAGHYNAMLGSTRNEGIPAEVFASDQGRWLGVQMEGQPERPRVLMVSVPYALKAADAETLGGLPASAFALAGTAVPAASVRSLPAATPNAAQTTGVVAPNLTGTGAANHFAYWTTSTNIGSSALYQTTTKRIGLGTTNPATGLEVDAATAGAILGNATATSGNFSGVSGNSASSTGNGVYGSNTAASGGIGVLGTANGTSGFAVGVEGQSASPTGNGVFGQALATTGAAQGVVGFSYSTSGNGVNGTALATSGNTNGVLGIASSPTGNGVLGVNNATSGFAVGVNGQTASPNGAGLFGLSNATTGGNGVQGQSNATSGYAAGVWGQSASTSGVGVSGSAIATSGNTLGVYGSAASPNGNGVLGINSATSGFAPGVNGQTSSPNGAGVNGVNTATTGGNGGQFTSNATSGFSNGVFAQSSSTNGNGVTGSATATSGFAIGVSGSTNSSGGAGVFGFNNSTGGFGLDGQAGASGIAVFGVNQVCTTGCTLVNGTAGQFVTGSGGFVLKGFAGTNQVFYVDGGGNGFFSGNLTVNGKVTKGSGSFKIDHPLDPEHKYLSHSFVESPDMMDVYNGVARLDAKGEAWVSLPDYFEALNGDFRYQLTAIGAPAPHLYIAREVSQNRFKIAGGRANGRVSWQVTGVRHDPYANAHRIPVAEDKTPDEQGHYLHPDVYGHPAVSQSSVGTGTTPSGN